MQGRGGVVLARVVTNANALNYYMQNVSHFQLPACRSTVRGCHSIPSMYSISLGTTATFRASGEKMRLKFVGQRIAEYFILRRLLSNVVRELIRVSRTYLTLPSPLSAAVCMGDRLFV